MTGPPPAVVAPRLDGRVYGRPWQAWRPAQPADFAEAAVSPNRWAWGKPKTPMQLCDNMPSKTRGPMAHPWRPAHWSGQQAPGRDPQTREGGKGWFGGHNPYPVSC